MTPVLVFDIETVPDVIGLRKTLDFGQSDVSILSDTEVAAHAFALRKEKTGSDFLPLHQHKIIAIGCLFRDQEGLRVRCLGQAGDSEAKLVQDFFKTIDRYTPQMVSWNGSGFDMQVLHYRALVHKVQAQRYWDLGDDDRDFKWNNYISRYHTRHTDLMDLLALYSARANAPLDDLAKICGFPGKLGMDGSQVWPAYQEGKLAEIRDYCETDVANTYLMYCQFQLFRGFWSHEHYEREMLLVRETLAAIDAVHWRQFLAAWPLAEPSRA